MKTLKTLTLNGTARENLIDQYAEVDHALRRSLAALREAYPNARDYASEKDLVAEQGIFTERIRVLQEMQRELYDESSAIADAPGYGAPAEKCPHCGGTDLTREDLEDPFGNTIEKTTCACGATKMHGCAWCTAEAQEAYEAALRDERNALDDEGKTDR